MERLKIMGARIKELRIERRLRQREMADLLGIVLQHYQKIEYGKVNIPVLTLDALADCFGVSADYLLGRTDERPKEKFYGFAGGTGGAAERTSDGTAHETKGSSCPSENYT
ncbi:MAG: helix-turn-helix transcriptional regulator [Oscillibacter sp.]|nr:helix-turn-helix transcriptional regulator [Oscillibacter sp.]